MEYHNSRLKTAVAPTAFNLDESLLIQLPMHGTRAPKFCFHRRSLRFPERSGQPTDPILPDGGCPSQDALSQLPEEGLLVESVALRAVERVVGRVSTFLNSVERLSTSH